jgi:hypothetical protein
MQSRQPTEEVPMSTAPTPKLVEPGHGKTIMLFGVRFDYRVTSADSGGALAVLEVEIPPIPWSSPTRQLTGQADGPLIT